MKIIPLKNKYGFHFDGEYVNIYREINLQWHKINSCLITQELRKIINWIMKENNSRFPSFNYLTEYADDFLFELRNMNII